MSACPRTSSSGPWRPCRRYPGPNRTLPVHAEHPENLFSLLDGAYEMHVVEDHTRLAPWRDAARLAGGARRVGAIAADLAVVYAHVVTPPGYARDLPALDQRRHGFGLQGDLGLEGEKDRAGAFRRFVSEIEGPASPALHFLHVLLPHTPWRYLPSGNTYHPFVRLGRRSGHTWPRDEWWVVEAWQRHLLQVRFVDRLLGELLERLDATGLYEPALVIVVADHGMAFWPGESARDFAMTSHPEDVLSVPLFVKRPGQREGAVSGRNVETVDVLPLVVHALGADPGWPFDGCSPFDPACPERADKVAFTEGDSRDENRAVRFPAGVSEQSAAVAKRLDVFGSSRDGDWLYRFGPYAGLVARTLFPLPTMVITSEPTSSTERLRSSEIRKPVA